MWTPPAHQHGFRVFWASANDRSPQAPIVGSDVQPIHPQAWMMRSTE
jgi:hypothetical protein